MFSSEASIQSARSSLRNPRRRQRTSDGLPQQPRRKRSKLNDESFVAKDETHINGNGSLVLNGHAGRESVEGSMVVVDMPVREKKGPSKRAIKEDDSQYLTKNANYCLKKLPGFPTALLRPSTPFHASALSAAGLALALTIDRALIWDFHAASGSTKVVSLSLPFNLRPTDLLPHGAIVRNGPSTDFGIVAVAPSNGKICFWENIDTAEARNLYPQHRQALEGSIKLYSGETITELVDIEHAGFVLVLSSGRLAHLTLRDSQGRPGITTTILNSPNGSSGSFFSFKGLLGGGNKKTVASVKARPSDSKGQMEVISVTRSGTFELWDLSWSGQYNFIRQTDVQAQVLSAVRDDEVPEMRSQQEINVLDFAILEQEAPDNDLSILLLVAVTGRGALDYSLVEIHLSDNDVNVRRAIPIQHYQEEDLHKEPTGTLLLPHPGHTAYVHFPGAVCVASLAEPEMTPDNQLLMDAGRPSLSYQDTIYFRKDIDVTVSGYALEQTKTKDKRAAALFFIQQYGIVQIIARHPATDTKDEERKRATARSKLEQATFFGTDSSNILDFSVKRRFSFTDSEIAQAALDVSSQILSSSHDHLEKVTFSLDEQFQKRAAKLRTLINRLKADYPPLSYQTKWLLLWQAEKLAAAHKLWLWYEEKLQDQQAHPEAYPENILMGDIVKALNERYKTPIQSELGETDTIRQFFLKNVVSLPYLIPWGWLYLRTFYLKEGSKEQPAVMQRLSESTDLMLVTMEAAFEFRQANVEVYDLDPESLDDAILKPGHGYDILPHFWTSSHNIVASIRSLVDVGRNLAVTNYEEGDQEFLAQKIGKDNPRLVKIGCQTHIERFQWALEQSDEKMRETGRSLRQEWNTKVRPSHILGLMEIGLATDGMMLAEKYRDMPTLVDLIWEETNWLETEKANTRSKMEQAESTVKLNRIKERISRYFDDFGDTFADAFYSKYVKENQAAQLFAKEYLNQPALTKYLRSDPSRARLRWINEVTGERNFEAAAACLYDAATKQETNSWCQRVELSIAKLAILCQKDVAGVITPAAADAPAKEKTKAERLRDRQHISTFRQLEYTKIQEAVHKHLQPIITRALDDDSAVVLLMAEFGEGRLKDRPAHQSILREGFENLVHHKVVDPALMVDILTLMNTDDNDETGSLLHSNEFVYALKVLILNWHDIHRTTRDGLLKLVWKRLCIKDDWEKINQTKDISDARLNDFLVHTYAGWTIRGLLKMMDQDPEARLVYPKKLEEFLGAGGTHGELCVRFGSEDLREPIIRDNLLDDDILRQHIEKHRLVDWFKAAFRAGKTAYDKQKAQRKTRSQSSLAIDDPEDFNVPEAVEEDEAGLATAGEPTEFDQVPGSDSFEGDIESVADQEQDVDMQDA